MAHMSPGVASLVMVDVEADDGTRVICSPEVQSVRTVRSLQQQLGTGGADRFGDEKDTHMPVIEVRFKLEKETKGALRYREVDEKGEVSEQAWAKIGTLYVRKSAFERGAAFPQTLRVTVETAGP